MIWPDFKLRQWAENGGVEPFFVERINPASIDLCLGRTVIDLISDKTFDIESELIIYPGMSILATTMEYITMPDDTAGTIYLKSSSARKGLDHALAGWIDPGFHGQITLELHAHRPFALIPGRPIVQLVLSQMLYKPIRTYKETGRYNGQVGPTKAR